MINTPITKTINELMREDLEFQKWCFDTELVTNKDWFNLENGSGDDVYVAFEAWCHSATREGYKLIPVDTLEEALSWGSCALSESYCNADRLNIEHHIDIIEKVIESPYTPNGKIYFVNSSIGEQP